MFTYLISPANGNQTTLLIALSVSQDTITGYVQNVSILSEILSNLRFIGRLFPRGTTIGEFHYCIVNYYSRANNITFTHRDGIGHGKLHSHHHELDIPHYHFKHPQKITYAVLENFLTQLEKCEPIQKAGMGVSISNSETIEDMLSKFKKYEKNLNKNIIYVTGNNPEYNSLSITKRLPTIGEHQTCLNWPEATGCTGNNPLSPEHLRLPTPNKEITTSNSFAETQALGGVVLLGAFALGIFACCRKPAAKNSQQKPSTRVNAAVRKRK